MPQLLNYIDEIARQKGRDVLWVTFYDPKKWSSTQPNKAALRRRAALIAFLDEKQIAWDECFECASRNLLISPYRGTLYLDVPYDRANPAYQTVAAYLETPDEKPRYADVHFLLLTLKAAIRNQDNRPVF